MTAPHTQILYSIAQHLHHHDHYIELGVCRGENFSVVAPLFTHATAVDILDRFQVPPNATKRIGTTAKFFKDHRPLNNTVDLIFVDADHAEEHVRADTFNALLAIKPNTGLVVLHDTYPPTEACLRSNVCHTAWKAAASLRLQLPELEVVTLPVDYGLTLIRRPTKRFHYDPDPEPHPSGAIYEPDPYDSDPIIEEPFHARHPNPQ